MEISGSMEMASKVQQPRTENLNDRQQASVKLSEGQSVSGKIVNLTPESVTLETEAGLITGALKELPKGVKIGDRATFTARQNDMGEPVLEIRQIASEAVQKAVVSEALTAAGLKTTPENVKMAMILFDNGLALTKENLLHFNQALKLMNIATGDKGEGIAESDRINEALFLIKSNLKISPGIAEALQKLHMGEETILKQLNNLADSISGIKDEGLRKSLMEVFEKPDVSVYAEEIAGEKSPLQAARRIIGAISQLTPEDLAVFDKALKDMFENPEIGVLKDPKLLEALIKELEQSKNGAFKIPVRGEEGINFDAKALISDIMGEKRQFFDQADKLFSNKESEIFQIISGKEGGPRAEDILKALNLPDKPEYYARNEISYIESKISELTAKDSKGLSNLFEKMRFDPRNTVAADVDKFLNELHESIAAAREILHKNPSQEYANIIKEFSDINRNLEFAAQLKENLFLQLPIMINDHQTSSELYVFKDSAKRKKNSRVSTALVALDTANLDRIETFIQKESSSVNLQFKVRSDYIRDTVSSAIEKLNEQLRGRGLSLQSCQFGLLDDKFTILSNPAVNSEQVRLGTRSRDDRRIVFDVRL